MEVYGRSCGCLESWRKVPRLHVGLQKVLQLQEKLTEYPADALKLDGWYRRCTENWQKITQPHRKLSEVKRKVQLLNKKFSTDRQKVDGIWCKVAWTNGELTECLADRHKVDECWWKSCCRMDIWRMFPRTHRKLAKVYGRSRGRTASWRKLKEDPADIRRIDR